MEEEVIQSRKGSHCLNCERQLRNEEYCPDCGQLNTDRHISIWTLIQDFLGDYFSFDSKLFRTLVPLVRAPGKVPHDFVDGKRVRHIPPLRIFIFISFLFFFVLGQVVNMEEAYSSFSEGLVAGSDPTQLTVQEDKPMTDGGLASFSINESDSAKIAQFHKDRESYRSLLDLGVHPSEAIDSLEFELEGVKKIFVIQGGKIYQSDPNTIGSFYLGNLSILLLIIQPLFAFMLWLIYIRRRKRFRYIGHVVFSLYFHSWLLLIGILMLLLDHFFGDLNLEIWMLLLGIVYLFFSIKRFYEQSTAKSIFKTLLISGLYMMFLFPTVILLSTIISFFLF